MGIFQQFPYTNFHEMNLDQIIKIMREMQDEWEETKTEWASYKDYIDNYFNNLNLDAETEAALRRLIADGTLDDVIDPVIADEVTEWLNDNIGPTTPAIDASLTVAGAGADAKVTGDHVQDINDFLYSIIDSLTILDNTKWIAGSYINSSNGQLTANANYDYQYLRIPAAGTWYTVRQSAFGSNQDKLALFDIDHTYVKTITGTAYDLGHTNWFSFLISEQDIKAGCRYAGVSRSGHAVTLPFSTISDLTKIRMTVPEWTIDRAKTLLYGKTLVCDGDSLAYGNQDLPDGYGAWWRRLVQYNNMSGQNYSTNGAAITKGLTFLDLSPRDSICTRFDTIYSDYPNADYILLEGGVNDADVIGSIIGGTIPPAFGTWSDMDFNSANFDVYTFCGAVDMLFYKAVTYYAGKKIGFIIPPQMGTSYSGQKNRRAYFDEIIKIAAKWHIPVLDLWKDATIDCRVVADYDPNMTPTQNVNAGKFYADGQHLTSAGYNLIQNKIQSWAASL